MGKKSKVGKRRRDKFYHLAKETGYRSRSAFKLIQLNRKFNFLQRSRVLIDLCAAPGGWLQVASKFMPMSSLIIGVDLVAIKAIPNVLCLQGDITTDKCRQGLARELKTWKVDCVLHDGAPNVGTNWEYDAFSQARLTLAALKLAANFLINGGCFLTKVFRSRDYQALMWIFQQLFKKVQATKPQASRNESAEIFVVCQGFLAADKIDSKFFDPKFAFKEVEEEVKSANNEARNKKPKAEGYTEGDYTQFHSFSVMDFVKGRNPTEFLRRCSEIKLDNADMVEHPSTTDELRECCRDIRVLGRKELRSLVVWRQKLRHFLAAKLKQEAAVFDDQTSSELLEQQQNREEQEEEEEEEEDLEKQIAELKEQEVLQLKRKKKTILKERRKLRARMELKMDLPGNSIDTSGETSLFNLMSVTKSKMGELEQGNMTLVEEEYFEEEYEDGLGFDEDEISLASDLDPDDMKEVEEREQRMKQDNLSDGTESHDGQEEEENPLLVDYEDRTTKVQRETDLWFAKDIFSGVGNEEDDAVEIQLTKDVYSKKINNEKDGKTHVAEVVSGATGPKGGVVPAVDSGLDSEGTDDERERLIEAVRVVKGYKRDWENAELQLALAEKHSVKKVRILDAEGLALGTVIATSRRRTRDLINNSFNRFVNGGEEDLPAWFSADERKNWRKAPEVERAAVTSYSNKWKEVNTHSIKKVAEAKARKKKKLVKRMEKARKKAEVVSDIVDISEKEKVAQIKSIYKKAGVVKKKREVSYIVAKKGLGGQSGRPRGVKGHYRMVDRRLKKDIRAKMSKRKGKGPAKSQDKGRHGSGKNRTKR